MVAMMPVSDPLSSLRCWLITIEGNRKLKKMASMHAEATRVNQDAFNILLEICMSVSEFWEIDAMGNVRYNREVTLIPLDIPTAESV